MSVTIAFVGAGNMAGSLMSGLIEQGFDPSTIIASDLDTQRLGTLQQQLGIRTVEDNLSAVKEADVVVLAVKPQVMKAVLEPLASILSERDILLVSIAAGITCSNIQQWAGQSVPVVRVMPNTPALVQKGASGLYANDAVSEQQRVMAEGILSAVGIALWFDKEEELDAVTAVSGSGPAYFFLVMEAMQQAGEKLGLSPDVARQLTLQTALGAAELANHGDEELAELRHQVTSPGGTTEAAINSLEQSGLRDHFEKALTAAAIRAKELSG